MPGFLLEDDAIAARQREWDAWMDQRKQQAEAAKAAASTAVQPAVQAVQQVTQPVVQATGDLLGNLNAEQQARQAEWDQWMAQRQTPKVTQPTVPTGTMAGGAEPPSLPHAEEPATSTDTVAAPDLGGRWKTQFDFGATYTGNYRTGTPHRGVDMVPVQGGIGTEVDAFAPGTVTNIARDPGAGGLMVYVQDDQGLTHAYMHLANTQAGLKVGQRVERGTPLAQMGESGTEGSPHLHYEVRKNAASGDPLDQLIDPRPYVAGAQTGPAAATSPVQTTAALSGGGPQAGQIGQAGQDLLSGGAQAASWLGEQGQKALQAVLVTEGGLTGARGDNSKSAGPLQFFGEEGGRGGQLNNFAQAFGMSLEQARNYVTEHPLEAIQWAVGTVLRPGYLGAIIGQGIAQGLSGPELATYVQQHGQVSVSPERAGQVWNSLFGQGQPVQQAAEGAERVVGSARAGAEQALTGAVEQSSAARAQAGGLLSSTQQLGDQLRQEAEAARAKYDQWQADQQRRAGEFSANTQRMLASANEPLARSPLLGQVGQMAQDFAQTGVGQQALNTPLPVVNQSLSQMGQALNPENLQTAAGALGGALQGAGREAARQTSDAGLLGLTRGGAEMLDRRLTPEGEQALRTVQNVVPGTVLADAGGVVSAALKGGGMQTTVNLPILGEVPLADILGLAANFMIPTGAETRFGEGALRTELTAAGRVGRASQQWAPALGLEQGLGRAGQKVMDQATATRMALSAAGRWTRASVEDIARELSQSPVGDFLRAESGELDPGALVQAATAIKREMTRMYHGTGSEFERPDPGRFADEGLFGPGYYLTDEPRIAGGIVAGRGQRATADEGEVLRSGYAQERSLQQGLAPEQKEQLQRVVDRAKATLAENPSPELRTYVERDLAEAQARLDTDVRGLGANVRAVDVPSDLRLLDAEAPLVAADRQAISDALRASPDRRDAVIAQQFDELTAGADATGKSAYDVLANVNPQFATRTLQRAGFDGITYEGGQRIRMADEFGSPIRHTAQVIFPESLDKIRNAISGRQGGQADPMLAMRLGGGAAGIASQEATMSEEDKSQPFTRLSRDLSGALLGSAAPGLAVSTARGIASTARGTAPSLSELQQIRQTLGIRQVNLPGTAGQPMTPGETLAAFGKQNLLAGAKSQVQNIISQMVELARTPARAALAGEGDQALLSLRAGVHGIPDATNEFKQTWLSGISATAPPGQKTTKWLPIFRFIGATDDFFRTLGAHMGMATEAQRLVNEAGADTPQAVQQVLQANRQQIYNVGKKEGASSVFQSMGAQGVEGGGNSFTHWKDGLLRSVAQSPAWQDQLKAYGKQGLGLVIDAIVPFSGMPAKIYDVGLGRIPVYGEMRRTVELGMALKRGDSAAAQRALGELGMQSITSSAILSNVMAGNVTDADNKDHPSSVRVGGTWVDYSGWGAFQLPLALPATTVATWRKMGNKVDAAQLDYVAALGGAWGKALSDSFYLNSVFDLATSIGQGGLPGAIGRTALSYTDRASPAFLNQAEQMIDTNVREVSKQFPKSVVDRVASRIPYLANTLATQVEQTTGGPRQREKQGPLGVLFGAETYTQPPIEREIMRLNQLGYAVSPPKANPTTISVNGAQIKLTEPEQRALGQARGERLQRVLGARMAAGSWDRLTDEQKAKVIARALNQGTAQNVATWKRMTPAEDRQTRVSEGKRVVGRLVDQSEFGAFTAPRTAA